MLLLFCYWLLVSGSGAIIRPVFANNFKIPAHIVETSIFVGSHMQSLIAFIIVINCSLSRGDFGNTFIVEALRLCTGRTAYRGSRGIALPFHDHGTKKGWGISVTPRPLFIPGKDPVPIVQEAGWAPGPVWTGAENLAPPGFDPRTVQPVAIRYTDSATRPTCTQ